jgi:glycosyltransferase involved in cell wall biosynthesis
MENNSKKTINRVIERKPFQGDVEIIIPFYGKHAHVSKLVQSVFNTIYSNRYLVTLVDDGSPNESYQSQVSNAKIPGLRVLRKEKQGGFGSAINFALRSPFKFSNSDKIIPYVVIMHSDVLLTSKDWLFNLGSSLEKMKSQGIKMVSPLTDNPVEEIGCLLSADRNPDREDVVLEGDDFLPLYCALCHRTLFDYVPMPEYPYAGFEAKEFSYKMKSKGFLQAACGKSWVHHEGRGTLKSFDKNIKIQRILRNVREEFEASFKQV